MEEIIDTGDFFAGMSGNQTESPANEDVQQEETTETTQEGTQEGAEAPENGETEEVDKNDPAEKDPAEGHQTFTIKVNKEERQVSLEEMTALAQKGADYDRVKDQVAKSSADMDALRKENEEHKATLSILEKVASAAKITVPEFLKQLRINSIVESDNVSREVAEERLARLDAEAKLEKSGKAEKETPQSRLARDVDEFRKAYPDVDISTLPVNEMEEDLNAGIGMTRAYSRFLDRRKDAEIAELKAQLEAEKQNKRNQKAPGSSETSGSKKNNDATSDFWRACT